jgi:predicted PurR-regulated permease PerM
VVRTAAVDREEHAMSAADEDGSHPGPARDELVTPGLDPAAPAEAAPDLAAPRSSPRWQPSTKQLAGIALGVAALGGLYLARNALALVALSGLIAFLVAPLIRVLQRRARFPKVLALLTSYVLVVAGFLLISGLIVTGIVTSFSEIDPAEAADTLRSDAVGWLTNVRTIQIGSYELDFSESVDPLIENLRSADPTDVAGETAAGPADGDEAAAGGEDPGEDGDSSTILVGGQHVDRLLGGLVTSAQTVGGLLVALLVTFLVALYLSADSHRFHAGLLAHIPPAYADDAARMSDRFGTVWRGYLYGQLVNSLATGLLVWLVLWAIGLPGAFVFGLIMMLLNMIPTFGPIIAAVPGVLAAIALGSTRLDWSPMAFTVLVIVVYVIVVQVQANLMAPFITGQAVQMSPATILIGLLVGFQVGGLVGSLLVVPVLASIKEAGKYVLAKLLDRDPFPDRSAAIDA